MPPARPSGRTSNSTGDIGVALVQEAFARLDWAFRPQPKDDVGIDAEAELRERGRLTGRVLAVQIKCGRSFFRTRRDGGWVFREDLTHLRYWLGHLMPVIVVLVDDDSREIYWGQVKPEAVGFTADRWHMIIRSDQKLDSSSAAALADLANAAVGGRTDGIESTYGELPGGAVGMIKAAREHDPDRTFRLAHLLARGKDDPRASDCRHR
ncbi:MAG: DUF4365 domain-containing protein [Betaproteobacteria bacterium]